MAEIDWDEIIRAAKSKKAEEKEKKTLEKRLDRMEKLLEKAVEEKGGARTSRTEPQPEKQPSTPISQPPIKVKVHTEKLRGIGAKLGGGFSSKFRSGGDQKQQPKYSKYPKYPKDGKKDLSQSPFAFSKKRLLIAIILAAAVVGVGVVWANSTGNLDLKLTGLVPQVGLPVDRFLS